MGNKTDKPSIAIKWISDSSLNSVYQNLLENIY